MNTSKKTVGLVSIIMPFKNTAKYLPECMASILQQDYQNWELLAVNDHSTDRSKAILQSYSDRDNRIHVLDNKSQGIIPALQTGYQASKGVWITRMDSDDIMTPNRLAWMVTALENAGQGHMAVGQVKYFSDRGISDGYSRYEKWLNALTATGSNYTDIYKECVIPSPCWMMYRTDFERCDGFEPNRYPEDYDLVFRGYREQIQVIPCLELLHYWRDYPSRTSRTHVHYAQNYFLDIKLHYFLGLDLDSLKNLYLWGAGFKGKYLAKSLKKKGIAFTWLCDNPKKIGKKIHGIFLHHFSKLEYADHSQSIITVANPKAQLQIKHFFEKRGKHQGTDFFFFC